MMVIVLEDSNSSSTITIIITITSPITITINTTITISTHCLHQHYTIISILYQIDTLHHTVTSYNSIPINHYTHHTLHTHHTHHIHTHHTHHTPVSHHPSSSTVNRLTQVQTNFKGYC